MDLDMQIRNIQNPWHFSGNSRANLLPNRVSFALLEEFCERPVEKYMRNCNSLL